jgi:hypothetical protein
MTVTEENGRWVVVTSDGQRREFAANAKRKTASLSFSSRPVQLAHMGQLRYDYSS